jgi:Uma2 family endonuclease
MAIARVSRHFTALEFERMAAMAIFGDDERVELLDGVVVPMTPIGDRHIGCVNYLTDCLGDRLRGRALIQAQSAIQLAPDWVPQPDVAILRRRQDYYRRGKARPEEVFLLIEVADTSASLDRDAKLPAYARGGIPEVWLVDLDADLILVARDPKPAGYAAIASHSRGSALRVPGFPDITLTVDEILGPPEPDARGDSR